MQMLFVHETDWIPNKIERYRSGITPGNVTETLLPNTALLSFLNLSA